MSTRGGEADMARKRGEYLSVQSVDLGLDRIRDHAGAYVEIGDRVRFRTRIGQGIHAPPIEKDSIGTIIRRCGGWCVAVQLDDGRLVGRVKLASLDLLKLSGRGDA